MVFEFEEEIFHQVVFFVSMPVSLSGGGSETGWNYCNSTPFLQPTYKFNAVIAFICLYEFAVQIKGFQPSLCHTDIISIPAGEQKALWIPKPIRYHMDFRGQAPSAPSGFTGAVH